MAASDQQVQTYVDTRIRPMAEQVRALRNTLADNLAAIEDIYNALNVQNPTWTDNRTDGPPHLLTPQDVLAMNTFMTDILAAINNDAQLPIALKACVRAV